MADAAKEKGQKKAKAKGEGDEAEADSVDAGASSAVSIFKKKRLKVHLGRSPPHMERDSGTAAE